MSIALGMESFDDWPRLTWSFGWIGTFDPISPPRSSMARLAITSLGIHVCLGSRPRLPHHHGEMLGKATRDDFICSLNDRLCQLGIEFPTARIHRGGRLLDKSERPYQRLWHALVSDAKILQAPLRLCAPIFVGRDVDRSYGIGLDSGFLSSHSG